MAANYAGSAAVDEMIARLRGFPDAIQAEAPELAQRVQAEVAKDIAAGRAPDGTPWPAKKDGGRALVNAAQALTSGAVQTILVLTLTGAEVWHHFGTRKVPRRQIIPVAGLTTNIAEAIRRGIVQIFKSKVASNG